MPADVESLPLLTPSLDELRGILESGLKDCFAEVEVNVVECPDLSTPPFNLVCPGICGSQKVIDVGGPPFLLPLVNRDKLYKVSEVAKAANVTSGLVIGAGAGPWPLIGVNSELMANVKLGDNPAVKSWIAKVNTDNQEGECSRVDQDGFALMANLYCSEGVKGKVLEVKAAKRTGEDNYMSCIRSTLAKHYKDKPVALGGTFLVESGKATLHVMPDFSSCPLNTSDDVDNWLNFYDYDAPLVAVGYLVSHDPGLDLRPEHFHCYSDHGVGGHYHYDVTPDTVSYRGYFGIAETLYRVDRAVPQK